MFRFMLIVNFIIIYANNMKNIQICNTCKWFIPNSKGNNDLGLCKIFKETYKNKDVEFVQNNYAKHCRMDENYCFGQRRKCKNKMRKQKIQNPIRSLKLNYSNSYKQMSNMLTLY